MLLECTWAEKPLDILVPANHGSWRGDPAVGGLRMPRKECCALHSRIKQQTARLKTPEIYRTLRRKTPEMAVRTCMQLPSSVYIYVPAGKKGVIISINL